MIKLARYELVAMAGFGFFPTRYYLILLIQIALKLRDCTCARHRLRTKVCGNGMFAISGGRIRGEKTLFARVCLNAHGIAIIMQQRIVLIVLICLQCVLLHV